MLSAIVTYSNMDGLRSTPQYGFSKGLKEFKQEEYNATVSKLNDTLIGINAVDMLDKKQITKYVYINALSYVMFLKREKYQNYKGKRYVLMDNLSIKIFGKKI